MPLRSRLFLWYVPAAIGVAAGVLFAVGFTLALRGAVGEPLGEPPPAALSQSRVARPTRGFLLVLGDSVARGTGDELGRGFAGDVLEARRKSGSTEMANLSVNGAVSGEVRALLESANVRNLVGAADAILLSVGGNDLSHAVGNPSESGAVERIRQARSSFVANLRAILAALREANPSAPIYLLGLYDPFGEETPAARLGASVILSWNAAAAETALAFPRVTPVPTFDLFYGRPDRLAADHFHPNRNGHHAIAQRLLQLMG
jgi:lysophospholipase L1-like esterase